MVGSNQHTTIRRALGAAGDSPNDGTVAKVGVTTRKLAKVSGLFYDILPSQCSRAYENMYAPKGDGLDARCGMARMHCEDLWSVFQDFADSNFKREFAINTHQRWFEMYLTVSLIRAGQKVACPKPGPDVLLNVDGRRIWIEAVCATSGQPGLPDSIRPPVFGQLTQEPTEQYVLRIRTALDEKQRKYRTYIQDGIVSCDDVTCVAINVYDVYGLDPYIHSHMMRSLYGIGDLQVEFSQQTGGIVDIGHGHVVSIRKSSGADVPVESFIDNSLKHVSAVLASHMDAFNRPSRLGEDFVLYPNLTGQRPWPQSVLNVGKEWRFEEFNDEWRGTLVEDYGSGDA